MMCISLFSYGSSVVVRCMGLGKFTWQWVGLGWVVGYENGPMDNSRRDTSCINVTVAFE